MIVDRFMGLLLGIFNALLSVLPEAGAPPGWVTAARGVVGAGAFFIPAQGLVEFIPVMAGFVALLLLWRGVRLLLPGG
jgi:hypothetical protein